METRSGDFAISLIIPVYNEEENVSILFDHILPFVEIYTRYEIIFIDDGSTDETLQKIKLLQKRNSNVHYVTLSKNFGHQYALKAGLDFCNGDVVITMDGDLQHPPSLFPEMIEQWKMGYDIVITTRKRVVEAGFFKNLTSQYFSNILTKISSIELKPGTADFRLLDKKVIDVLRRFTEADIFYRGFVAWVGFRQFELSYTPDKRATGKTKYTFRKMLQLASSGLLGFSTIPLRAVTLVGFVFSCASFLYGFYAVFIRFFSSEAVSGWASIMAGIYFLGGIQLISLGICGEYIGRIFMQTKKRPHYIVKDTSLLQQ